MSYLIKSNRNRSGKFKKALIFVVLFLGLAYGFKALAPSFMANTAHTAASPFWKANSALSGKFGYLFDFIQARKNIVDENRRLRQELIKEESRLARLQVLEKENADLKKVLERENLSQTILAYVLSKPPQMLFDTLIIDAGQNLGVEKDSIVWTEGGIAIGKIEEVLGKTSRVMLFSTSREETSAFIARNNLSVTLIGRGGGDFEMELPQETDILPEDMIVMPGEGNMILARVVNIEYDPADSFKTVFAKSLANVSEIRRVLVGN